MLDKGLETWGSLYKDQVAVAQLRATYMRSKHAGKDRSDIIAAIAMAIRQQEEERRYISLHLRSQALDVRVRELSAAEIAILRAEAMRKGAKKAFFEAGSEPHLHIQF